MTFLPSIAPRTLAASAATLLLAVLALGAARAQAAPASAEYAECEPVAVSQAFAAWGDFDDYFTIGNGSFDDGADGWTLAGASEVLTTERGNVLSLGAGAEAISSPVCFDDSRTHARFFARALDGERLRGDLEVALVYTKANGQTGRIKAGEVDGRAAGSQWSPSPQLDIELDRAKIAPNAAGERIFQFHLEAEGTRTWEIDDLMVDPRRRQ